MGEDQQTFTEPNTPTDVPSAPILYCPACGGAISLEDIPIDTVISAAKRPKPMPGIIGLSGKVTLSEGDTILEEYYV